MIEQDGCPVLSDQDREQFVALITRYQRRLQVYVRGLVPHSADAEEVLQEVNLFLWRNAEEYRPGSDFGAWAYKVAYFHVLTYRKRLARNKLRFTDALLQQLAESGSAVAEATDRRQDALEHCIQKLPEADRQLVHLRYQGGSSVQELADELKRSAKAIYRSLDRIHLALLECVRRRLQAEDGA
jgi:RNA polymerase sigma-70 factor, ECF subfamily